MSNSIKTISGAFFRERTVPTDRPTLVNEVSANFEDRGCRVFSATDPYGSILGFLDRRRYCLFQIAPQLYSWCWVDPVPDPLLFRQSGSAGNRNRDLWICSQELWPLDHRGGPRHIRINLYSRRRLRLKPHMVNYHSSSTKAGDRTTSWVTISSALLSAGQSVIWPDYEARKELASGVRDRSPGMPVSLHRRAAGWAA
jgi:hypothetical protein